MFNTPVFANKINSKHPLGQILSALPDSELVGDEENISILSLQSLGFLLCGGDN